MHLVTKWLLTSIGGGILITAGLLTLPDSVVDFPIDNPVAAKVVEIVFWPIAVCTYLSGPGAPIGPPEEHKYEATPVQMVAAFLGVGVTWSLYSSLGFLIFWLRRRQRLMRKTTVNSDSPSMARNGVAGNSSCLVA
jgi:hypothetical protein